MNRIPLECDVVWYQSRPRIDFKLSGEHPDNAQVFRGEDPGELLRKIVCAHARLLVEFKKVCRENKNLRRSL